MKYACVDAQGWLVSLYDSKEPGLALIEVAWSEWPRPLLPNVRMRWTGSWVWVDARTLEEAKAARVAVMRDARDAAINGTFTWDGSAFDADQVSQTRILGLKVASTGADFTSKAWRLADNTWRVLSAAAAAGVWTALETHIEDNFKTFALREAAIGAAATVAAVDAITWEGSTP